MLGMHSAGHGGKWQNGDTIDAGFLAGRVDKFGGCLPLALADTGAFVEREDDELLVRRPQHSQTRRRQNQ